MNRAGQGGRKNYTSVERKTMILTVLAVAIQNGENRWLTPYQLSRRIGMSNCPSFRHFITEMEADGLLVRREMSKNGRWKGHEFSLAPGAFIEPKKRSIPIKQNGKAIGQMELF